MVYTIKQMSPLFLVGNLENSIEFYTTKLGFRVDFLYEDFYAGIIKDGYSIHLKHAEHEIAKNRKSDEDIDITFSVNNIEDLYSYFQNEAIEITQPLRQMPYGKEFYVADPDNNILAFLE